MSDLKIVHKNKWQRLHQKGKVGLAGFQLPTSSF